YQITSALKHLSFGKHIAVLTDARFSGVSTGACIGHVGPEALAGGPVGKVRDGDTIQIIIDRNRLEGSVELRGAEERTATPEGGEPGGGGGAPAAGGPGTGPAVTGRHPAVGGAPAGRRRDVGRVCVRCGGDRTGADLTPRPVHRGPGG